MICVKLPEGSIASNTDVKIGIKVIELQNPCSGHDFQPPLDKPEHLGLSVALVSPIQGPARSGLWVRMAPHLCLGLECY